jgi:3-methyladenine DNA glycosylase Mpg
LIGRALGRRGIRRLDARSWRLVIAGLHAVGGTDRPNAGLVRALEPGHGNEQESDDRHDAGHRRAAPTRLEAACLLGRAVEVERRDPRSNSLAK